MIESDSPEKATNLQSSISARIIGVAESRYEFTSRKVAKAQREKVLKYPIFSFHTSIQQRRIICN
ncbi:MAG: hypothetical protein DSM106950_38150 [Stigonema ocellatum SAG 48.90 = DSM 106950]|nr:hypothetical protein [Stigonema ocellatum SAG 48.90 = DSM 106950]